MTSMERRKQLTVAWLPTFSENYIPQNVFVGGHDSTSHEQLFIGRAMHNKWLIPGKIPRGRTTLLVPYFGKEIPVEEFEILVALEKNALQWVPQRDGAYPENAAKGGFEDDVILYVARAKDPDGGACIGKLHPRHKVYISHDSALSYNASFSATCAASLTGSSGILQLLLKPAFFMTRMQRRKQLTVAWVPTISENVIPQNVFVGGYDSTSHEQLFIGRAMHDKCLIQGKIPRNRTTLLIPYYGREIPVREFEILTSDDKSALQWISQRDGAYPENAVKGGFEGDTILYVARAKDPDGGQCIGKLYPEHKVCYFPWKGKELTSSEYEVLSCVPGVKHEMHIDHPSVD